MSPVAALGSQPAVYQTGWALVGSVGHHPIPVRVLEFKNAAVGPPGGLIEPRLAFGGVPPDLSSPYPPPSAGGVSGGAETRIKWRDDV